MLIACRGALCTRIGRSLPTGRRAQIVLPPPPPPSRTKWTRRVPHPVLIGHAASLSQIVVCGDFNSVRQTQASASTSHSPACASEQAIGWNELTRSREGRSLTLHVCRALQVEFLNERARGFMETSGAGAGAGTPSQDSGVWTILSQVPAQPSQHMPRLSLTPWRSSKHQHSAQFSPPRARRGACRATTPSTLRPSGRRPRCPRSARVSPRCTTCCSRAARRSSHHSRPRLRRSAEPSTTSGPRAASALLGCSRCRGLRPAPPGWIATEKDLILPPVLRGRTRHVRLVRGEGRDVSC